MKGITYKLIVIAMDDLVVVIAWNETYSRISSNKIEEEY